MPFEKHYIFDFIANVKRVVFRIERHVQTKKREKDIGH